MTRIILRSALILVPVALIGSLRLAGQTPGQPSTKNGDWTHYTGDVHGTRY